VPRLATRRWDADPVEHGAQNGGVTGVGIPERLGNAVGPDVEIVTRAPGRANLIGEHTDYNDGFVLPVALELATYVAGARSPGVVRLSSLDEPGEVVVDLRSVRGPEQGWGRYVTAVVRALSDESVGVRGFNGALCSDVPAGAGLSSSAALEVAVALAVADEVLDAVTLARICRRAENVYVGVDSGILDQLASAAARAGHALLIDCRDDSVEPVPVPEPLAVVVIHSGVQRGLTATAYNERRAECRRAAGKLGLSTLREASVHDVEQGLSDDDIARRRARHVVTENGRVLDAARALRDGAFDQLGELFAASHRSLANDYEVSSRELDDLVSAAWSTPGVVAARLTGAGFGGCTVNLVQRARADEIAAEIARRYVEATERRPRWWVSRPAAGARVLSWPE
jgi:galactokinase